MAYLDGAGLEQVWGLIKANFVAKEAGKGLSTNDFTDELKSQLEGLIETGGEVNQNAFSNVAVGGTTIAANAKTDTLNIAAGANVTLTPDAATKSLTIAATDTTYEVATTSANGLMSSTDKTKLDGVAEGAEVNQNAFSTVVAGGTSIAAGSKTASVSVVAGENVTVTGNASTGTVTIAATDTTYDAATTTAAGLMSAADKTKLDGIAAGGQVNVIEEVQVNGAALTPTNKAVNVTIAEGSTNGAISVNGSSVAVHGLGSAAYVNTEATVANDGNVPTGAAVQTYVTGLGYQTASDVASAISTAVASAYVYKGSVATESALPSSGQQVGDVYNIEAASQYGPAGMNVAWNGTAWDALGSSISVETLTASEIAAICV